MSSNKVDQESNSSAIASLPLPGIMPPTTPTSSTASALAVSSQLKQVIIAGEKVEDDINNPIITSAIARKELESYKMLDEKLAFLNSPHQACETILHCHGSLLAHTRSKHPDTFKSDDLLAGTNPEIKRDYDVFNKIIENTSSGINIVHLHACHSGAAQRSLNRWVGGSLVLLTSCPVDSTNRHEKSNYLINKRVSSGNLMEYLSNSWHILATNNFHISYKFGKQIYDFQVGDPPAIRSRTELTNYLQQEQARLQKFYNSIPQTLRSQHPELFPPYDWKTKTYTEEELALAATNLCVLETAIKENNIVMIDLALKNQHTWVKLYEAADMAIKYNNPHALNLLMEYKHLQYNKIGSLHYSIDYAVNYAINCNAPASLNLLLQSKDAIVNTQHLNLAFDNIKNLSDNSPTIDIIKLLINHSSVQNNPDLLHYLLIKVSNHNVLQNNPSLQLALLSKNTNFNVSTGVSPLEYAFNNALPSNKELIIKWALMNGYGDKPIKGQTLIEKLLQEGTRIDGQHVVEWIITHKNAKNEEIQIAGRTALEWVHNNNQQDFNKLLKYAIDNDCKVSNKPVIEYALDNNWLLNNNSVLDYAKANNSKVNGASIEQWAAQPLSQLRILLDTRKKLNGLNNPLEIQVLECIIKAQKIDTSNGLQDPFVYADKNNIKINNSPALECAILYNQIIDNKAALEWVFKHKSPQEFSRLLEFAIKQNVKVGTKLALEWASEKIPPEEFNRLLKVAIDNEYKIGKESAFEYAMKKKTWSVGGVSPLEYELNKPILTDKTPLIKWALMNGYGDTPVKGRNGSPQSLIKKSLEEGTRIDGKHILEWVITHKNTKGEDIQIGDKSVLEYIMEQGWVIKEESPLKVAIESKVNTIHVGGRDIELISYALSKGWQIDHKDVLEWGIERNNQSVIKYLLLNGHAEAMVTNGEKLIDRLVAHKTQIDGQDVVAWLLKSPDKDKIMIGNKPLSQYAVERNITIDNQPALKWLESRKSQNEFSKLLTFAIDKGCMVGNTSALEYIIQHYARHSNDLWWTNNNVHPINHAVFNYSTVNVAAAKWALINGYGNMLANGERTSTQASGSLFEKLVNENASIDEQHILKWAVTHKNPKTNKDIMIGTKSVLEISMECSLHDDNDKSALEIALEAGVTKITVKGKELDLITYAKQRSWLVDGQEPEEWLSQHPVNPALANQGAVAGAVIPAGQVAGAGVPPAAPAAPVQPVLPAALAAQAAAAPVIPPPAALAAQVNAAVAAIPAGQVQHVAGAGGVVAPAPPPAAPVPGQPPAPAAGGGQNLRGRG